MDQGKPIYFEDVEVGDELGPLTKTPALDEIKIFCRLYQEPEPNRFTDLEAAKREGVPFLIIPGGISMAYLSQLITGWAPNVTLKRLDVIFRGRIRQEEPIHCRGLITDKEVRQGENCVECDLYIEDSERQRVVTGKAIAVIPSRS